MNRCLEQKNIYVLSQMVVINGDSNTMVEKQKISFNKQKLQDFCVL